MASGDPARFKMLVEMGRRTIVEKWNLLLNGNRDYYEVTDEEKKFIVEFYRDEFLHTLIVLAAMKCCRLV